MQADETEGQILGHYRILRPLGYGGTATVFLAQDINLHREVAVKVFRPREGNAQEFLRRFAREARVLAKLDHPNILPVYDYGEQGETAYIVMPYLPGGSLRERLQKDRALPVLEAVGLIDQILKALQYAQDRSLIHRDIKPGNLLFKSADSLLLSDFGLVKVVPNEGSSVTLDETFTASGQSTISGTPEFMAPEQINGQTVPASDQYAIGVVLYQMLTGQHPFTADNYLGVLMKHLHEQPTPPRTLNPRISPQLEQVILRALAKDPARRYASPEEMRQALQQALLEEQTSVGSVNRPAPPAHARPANPAVPAQPNPAAPVERSLPAEQPVAYAFRYSPAAQPVGQRRPNRLVPIALLLSVVVVLGSVGVLLYGTGLLGSGQHPGIPMPGSTTTATQTTPPAYVSATVGTTVPSSSITTACPDAGKARAAVTAILPILVVGSHQNIIYIVNEFAANKHATFGTVKRHDITTNTNIEINKMAGVSISEAQVGQNGQWVLFTAKTAGHDELRMVRVDGQGLQTLYCAPAQQDLAFTQWSFNQRLVVFNVSPQGGLPTTYLLDITTGVLQPELVPQGKLGFRARTWLDETHIYLTGFVPNSDSPPQDVYILDTAKGANQHDKDLQRITVPSNLCTSYDSSYDSTQLFVSSCTPSGVGLGTPGAPSTITEQPAMGGTPKTIFSGANGPSLAITLLRTISPTTLLLLVENYSGDSTNDGLWRINTDGTGLTRLTTDMNHAQALCPFSQYSWSNVSPNGDLFALQYFDQQTNNYRMYSGSLQTGTLDKFADISDGTQLMLVGWNKM